MTLYRITAWAATFEVSDATKTSGPLKWLATPTKHEGVGFRRVAAQRDRSDLFSAWILMIQISAKLPKRLRGALVDATGTPLDAEALSLKTGWSEQVFERALKFFSDPKQGWLTVEIIADQTTPPAAPSSNGGSAPLGTAEVHDDTQRDTTPSGDPGKSAEISGEPRTTGQDITGQIEKTSSSPPTSAPPPSEGERFVVWFLALLTETGATLPKLTPSARESWADCYDKLLRLDGRTKEQVKEVCRWARNDAFWCKNFLSPMKLRERKDGVLWFDAFAAKMNAGDGRAGGGNAARNLPPQWRLTDADSQPTNTP